MITRRKFLINTSKAVGGLAATQIFPGCFQNIDPGKKLFSFVQINDTHLVLPGNKGYPKVEEKLRSVISSINSEENFPLPDFVIFVGDIIEGAKLRLLQPECEFAKSIMDQLKCPYYTVVGNHETLNTEGNPRFLNAYIRTFGEDKIYYSFIHKEIHFILFDNSNGLGTDKDVTIRRNEWLKNALESYDNYPKIIVSHIPLVSFRADSQLSKSFGFWNYKLQGDNTFNIIQSFSDKIIAILNGHVHLTGLIKTNDSIFNTAKNTIYHISPSGLASYPCHYAHYTVNENNIQVKMIQVKKELVTPESNIHGKYYHKIDFIDQQHKSPEDYVCGNYDERNFSIPMIKKANFL